MILYRAGRGVWLAVSDRPLDNRVLGVDLGTVRLVGDAPVQPRLGNGTHRGQRHGQDRVVAGLRHAPIEHDVESPRATASTSCHLICSCSGTTGLGRNRSRRAASSSPFASEFVILRT